MIIHSQVKPLDFRRRCYDSLMSRTAVGSAAGYVLAGGASTRMGTDKAMLETAGIPLVKRAVEIVEIVAGTCAVVAPGGRYEALGLRVLRDRFPGKDRWVAFLRRWKAQIPPGIWS